MAAIDQLQLPLGTGTPTELLPTVLGSTLGWAEAGAVVEAYNGVHVGNADRVYMSDVLSDYGGKWGVVLSEL